MQSSKNLFSSPAPFGVPAPKFTSNLIPSTDFFLKLICWDETFNVSIFFNFFILPWNFSLKFEILKIITSISGNLLYTSPTSLQTFSTKISSSSAIKQISAVELSIAIFLLTDKPRDVVLTIVWLSFLFKISLLCLFWLITITFSFVRLDLSIIEKSVWFIQLINISTAILNPP